MPKGSFVYVKENIKDNTEIAYSSLRGILKSEGIDHIYTVVWFALKIGKTFDYGNFRIRKLTLIHQRYGKRKTKQ